MSIDLNGKTALITGASRGIGEAAARVMAGYGANVVLAARSTDDIERIAAEIGDKAMAVNATSAAIRIQNAVATAKAVSAASTFWSTMPA
jgi:3-oxoacyl-[acyl-carrier protein] reductase